MLKPLELPLIVRLALRRLPGAMRRDLRVLWQLYADCEFAIRRSFAEGGAAAQSTLLALHQHAMNLEGPTPPESKVFDAARPILAANGIPRRVVLAMLDGFQSSQMRRSYRDWSQLEMMLRQTAASPMTALWQAIGATGDGWDRSANNLGMALKNALLISHLHSCLQSGRVPIPVDELERFQVSDQDLAQGRMTKGMQDVLWLQVNRCRALGKTVAVDAAILPTPNARAFVTILTSWIDELLDHAEGTNFSVIRQDYELGLKDAVRIAIRSRA